jgi:hypothetical protein
MTTKRADQIQSGDVLLRFGKRCKVLSASPAKHPFLVDVIQVIHCDAGNTESKRGEVNYTPAQKVEVEA